MSKTELKNKITKTLEQLDDDQLRSAYQIIKELLVQEKYSSTPEDKILVDRKITTGIKQLDNNEGKDFSLFLNELEATYGKKK